ncbi:MAG: protein kinase [Deltaproteobacteria bacterium]|nr:protein kinase [Deltaproteobacteria bacterium]
MKIGDVFGGRFRLLEAIGEGGMGAVFRAEQLSIKREVALKILHPHVAHAPRAAERFHREALVLGKLKHPNSVEVYDLGEAEGTFYIAMELLSGSGLDALLWAGGPMQGERVARISMQVLEALDEAHAHGIVHRDIKPGNIFLLARPKRLEPAQEPADRLKVLDFGIAFLREDSGGRITQQGQTAGTPGYMSPEQCRGEPVDGRSDLYALGCTMYEMITGDPPFGRGEHNPMEVVAAQLYKPPLRPLLARVGLELPRAIEDVVMQALAKLPQARFADARAMHAALQAALSAQPLLPERGHRQGRLGGDVQEVAAAPAHAASIALVGADTAALATALSAVGHTIVELREAREVPKSVSLVIVGDGPGALTSATALVDGAPKTPVLLCGSESDLDTMARAAAGGIFDYVPLPLDPVELSRKVGRALRRIH